MNLRIHRLFVIRAHWRIQGGGAPGATQFFRFDIQILRNVAALGVHAPPYEVHAPLREILGPPLGLHL